MSTGQAMTAFFQDPPMLLRAWVIHHRTAPVRHYFKYAVFYVRIRIDQNTARWPRLMSRNRWNVLSIYDADYGPRVGGELLPWIRGILSNHGLAIADGPVYLQTLPRLFGYVFNPVSFWLCYDKHQQLRAVLCEVNNTFGEHHHYLIAHRDTRPILPTDRISAEKIFYVSPFLPVKGQYQFRFSELVNHSKFRIDYQNDDAVRLLTQLTGELERMTSWKILKACVQAPWMTLAIWMRIHDQALWLWVKQVPLVTKPSPPKQEVSR